MQLYSRWWKVSREREEKVVEWTENRSPAMELCDMCMHTRG